MENKARSTQRQIPFEFNDRFSRCLFYHDPVPYLSNDILNLLNTVSLLHTFIVSPTHFHDKMSHVGHKRFGIKV